MIGPLSQFQNAVQATGLIPPDVIEPGKLQRFPGRGKPRGNRAAWCILFDDGLGGAFGDWSTGLSESWQARRERAWSPVERATFARRVAQARLRAEAERGAIQSRAAIRARAIWNAATPAPRDYPYLLRKGIDPHGARLHKGALTLPVMTLSGELTSLQFIKPDGCKMLLSGGRKSACFIPITGNFADFANSAPGNCSRLVICEGWATGCSLAEDERAALVLAAIDAGNLELVALAARSRWPSAEIVIAGDDDRLTAGNPGATKAQAAAIAADALLALPQWPKDAPESLSDFNDLSLWLRRGAA